jgi:hypothetical protein
LEGSSTEDTPTGIIWCDLQPLANFNWQVVLNSADAYCFIAEVKFGATLIDPGNIPVLVNSRYSPEALPPGGNALGTEERPKITQDHLPRSRTKTGATRKAWTISLQIVTPHKPLNRVPFKKPVKNCIAKKSIR